MTYSRFMTTPTGMAHAQLLGRLQLRFDAADDEEGATPQNLSAAARDGRKALWLASDERGFLDRLSIDDAEPRIYRHHERFTVADHLQLDGEDEEIDIEALDLHDGALWLVGSHSAKRKKPKGRGDLDDLKRLATVKRPQNRLVLARLPLVNGKPQKKTKGVKLAVTEREGAPSNPLLDALAEDEHLAPFLASGIPSKDNGLDIEGLAVRGNTAFIGLRGPVLRGYAVLLVVDLAEKDSALHLGKKKYRKLFLDLDGLGIRELSFAGDDLLVLAGPTMSLDGAIRLYRLSAAAKRTKDAVIAQDDKALTRLYDVPHTEDGERAEGVTLFSWFDDDDSMLVVYDRPAKERLYDQRTVLADIFRLKRNDGA